MSLYTNTRFVFGYLFDAEALSFDDKKYANEFEALALNGVYDIATGGSGTNVTSSVAYVANAPIANEGSCFQLPVLPELSEKQRTRLATLRNTFKQVFDYDLQEPAWWSVTSSE